MDSCGEEARLPNRPDPTLSGSGRQQSGRWDVSSGHSGKLLWHCDEMRTREQEWREGEEKALGWSEVGPVDTPEGAMLACLALREEQRRAPVLALHTQFEWGVMTSWESEDGRIWFCGMPETVRGINSCVSP